MRCNGYPRWRVHAVHGATPHPAARATPPRSRKRCEDASETQATPGAQGGRWKWKGPPGHSGRRRAHDSHIFKSVCAAESTFDRPGRRQAVGDLESERSGHLEPCLVSCFRYNDSDAQLASTRRAAKGWVVVSFILLALSVAPISSEEVERLLRLVNLVYTLGWCFSVGRVQGRYVKARFGTSYPRRPWGKPLLLALAGLLAVVALAVAMSYLTEQN